MGQLGSKANKKDEKTEVVESDVSHENVPNENKNVPENEQKLQTKPAMSKKTSAVCAVALPSMGTHFWFLANLKLDQFLEASNTCSRCLKAFFGRPRKFEIGLIFCVNPFHGTSCVLAG